MFPKNRRNTAVFKTSVKIVFSTIAIFLDTRQCVLIAERQKVLVLLGEDDFPMKAEILN